MQMQAYVADRIEYCLGEENHTILVAERRPDCAEEEGAPLHPSAPTQAIVIGYVAVHWFFHLLRGSDGYVSELFLRPDETGHGVGSRLLDAVYTYAHQRGCIQLILVNRRIRVSYRRYFYAKHGWEEQPEAAFFPLILSTPESHNEQQHDGNPGFTASAREPRKQSQNPSSRTSVRGVDCTLYLSRHRAAHRTISVPFTTTGTGCPPTRTGNAHPLRPGPHHRRR
jgi:GNAT superfamily N-acetyltransferase